MWIQVFLWTITVVYLCFGARCIVIGARAWLRSRRKRPVLPLHHLKEHYLSKDGTKVLVECPHCGIRSSRATEITEATQDGNGGSPRS